MRPEVLFRLLYDVGARYRVDGDTLRFPRGTVPPDLANDIRENKLSLLAGPCELCDAELATHGDRCRWCDAVRGREAAYAPDSPAERAFLAALERSLLRYERAA